ncbi:hypothetical protein A2943_00105 [Candidatus Adlerbacteria bacterium RIFCSPLOWO2_01_FULL_51_16]|uniref:HD domain-containing protein n=1 Tax=Candidatus Adlerbacteria bacterium RIFCSPLOWO2_01_FULL_51_16 TaxID=1797243 RepID=A0A1F4XF29_9BACT|nr:MAG: hypothetical protein A2943_00105 [Candidatus Adlerbacteria bacterium RIFCSPLOWO2_01_FULL_51_16]
MDSASREKTRYFSKFALAHLREMRILKAGKILGPESEGWRNVAQHCLAEAVGADILAEHLGADRSKVVRGTLLHDWYKRGEIAARREHGGMKGYLLSSAEDEQLLVRFGVTEDIIRIAHANIPETEDLGRLAQRPLEEKIMHFMDMITDQSSFIESEERLQKVERNPMTLEFLESFRPRYGGKHLNEIQREVLTLEQAEFESILGIEHGTLVPFLNHEVQKRIG